MSKFWGDFGQAFLPAYGQSTQRTDRLAAVARAEAAQEAALKLAAEQRKDDLIWRQRQADIAQANLLRKEQLDREAAKRIQDKQLEDIRAELTATPIEAQRDAYKGIGGVPMRGLPSGTEAMTLTPSLEELKGLPRGSLVQAKAQAVVEHERLKEIAKAERGESAAARAKEKPIGQVVNEIIQMRGQLGDSVPKQTRQALEIMGDENLRGMHGGLTERLAVRKRERDIADSKEKGTGLSGSTRGYKAAAEAGVRYDELLKDIEKDLKAGKEPDPLKMREMKSNMAHVMAFYTYPGRLVPPHLEDLVRGAGRTPNNAILTDMANAHELSMYGESLAKDIKHLSEKYGKDKMTAFIGPIQKPLSELLTVFGIDDENEDRFIVNRLSQKYQDMANYKLFIESGKTVTEQEFKRLKTVVGDPTREDFLEKLLGFAQLQTERTQRKLKAYKDVGLRFNPDLEKAIYKGATPQGSGGLSSAEDTELQKLKEAKAANLMDDAAKRRYLELLNKLAEEN